MVIMKKKDLFGAFLIASLAFSATACSDDASVVENENPIEQEQGEFKLLGNFNLASQLGQIQDDYTQSRTPGDITEDGRPTDEYHLNKIGLMSLTPTVQPTSGDVNQIRDFHYKTAPEIVFHDVNQSTYKVYYKVEITGNNEGASDSGKIILSTDAEGRENRIEFALSVFKKDQLVEGGKIRLNDMAFNATDTPRGSTLRYVSYNPKTVGGGPSKHVTWDINETDAKEVKLTGQVVELPSMPSDFDNVLKGETKIDGQLVEECKDEFFSGEENLIAYSDGYVYMLETVTALGEKGGHYIVKRYPNTQGQANPEKIALNRITSLVNTSFMLLDQKIWKESTSYFIPGNEAATLNAFKNKYAVDITDLECPYATLDGINKKFFINEYQSEDKTTDLSRLVVWAKGHKTTGVNGTAYDKEGQPSMNISYQLKGGKAQGYGIKGNSYSVVFTGSEADTKNQQVNFWVKVSGVNVRIKATLSQGISLSPNQMRDIIVFVDAEAFTDFIKKQKEEPQVARSAEDYPVFEVPADRVMIR